MWRIWGVAWEWCSNSDECNCLYHGLYTVISLRCTGQLRCTLSVRHLLYGVRLHSVHCPLQTAPSYSHALLYKHSSLRLHLGYTLLLYSYTKY